MPLLTVATETRIYRVSPDDAVPTAGRFRALVAGRVVDELTNEPPRVRVELRVREPGFVAQVNTDNVFTLAGIARDRFSLLATQPYDLHLTVRAAGYVPLDLTATVPQTVGFPTALPLLVELGDVPLHREPVIIAGRVVNKLTSSPSGGATVRIAGIWPTMPPPNVALPPPDPPNLVSIRAPLYSVRDTAAGKARIITLTPGAPISEKILQIPAAAGTTMLALDNRISLSLAGGDLLSIDSGSANEEFVTTTKVHGASTPDQPAEVTLAVALRNSHHLDASVKIVTPQAPGPDKPITQPAMPGDPVIFVSDLVGWAGANAVEIHGGAAAEYHTISRFTATTDAEGFYQLPPISRVAWVRMEVQGATQVPDRSLNYTESINHMDFRL
jgi:hypothetical protein